MYSRFSWGRVEDEVTKGKEKDGIADPFELLEKGDVSGALVATLDLKETDALLKLLKKVTPTVVIEKCKKSIVLCTTQQLAVDLAIRQPPEGLEDRLDWIKNLVSHVVFNKDSSGEDQSAEMQAKVNAFMNTVMSSVKQAIEATKERLQKEHGDTVPSAVMTDLQLLGHIVQSFA